ncbi:hypothetical protein HC031_29720 [Planosporangium thailandense]|uniref:Uncharacterized protein n=1 Tax=Planosporangium thailandense TaxID=765197 RepID=A0ABX0Y627_9ACTN|nr:hypothetical protein [Planosporangium thailandense]NJC73860.1 hypothetical protein [Planosporangium thailandense]
MRPVPTFLVGLLDDAAVFPPGNAPLADAVAAHRDHRSAPYAEMVGPLLVRPDDVAAVPADLEIGVVGPCDAVAKAVGSGRSIRQVEVPVAKRGEDPQPGLRALLSLVAATGVRAYAETPLTWGLAAALDTIAEARATGLPVAPKFRTGGLAAELFPTPVELAAVICACRDRALPFKLTAGLHHARRHADPETGFTHHGFLNVLAATIAAADGAEPAAVAALLAAADTAALVAPVRGRLEQDRPLWLGFGTCSIAEPVADLRQLGLLPTTGEALT